jgi:hypothetical protein
MNISTWLKTGALALSVSLLAACGGSDSPVAGGSLPNGTPTVNFNNAAWASPGVFVPYGQSKLELALQGCTTQQVEEGEPTPLLNAKLVIASNGNMSIIGSMGESTETMTVFEQPFVDTNLTAWGVSGSQATPTYNIFSMLFEGQSEGPFGFSYLKFIQVNTGTEGGFFLGGDSSGQLQAIEGSMYGPSTQISCETIATPTIHAKLDNARAAKNLGAEAGVASFDGADADGEIDGGIAYWENGEEGSDEFRYLRFNLTTGELASKSTPRESTATYTPISLSLPTGSDGSSAQYTELICRGAEGFNFREAKGIALSSSNEATSSSLYLSAFAYGSRFAPNANPYKCLQFIGPA